MKYELDFEDIMESALKLPNIQQNMPKWGDFMVEVMEEIEEIHPDLYEKLTIDFFAMTHAWHFDRDMAEYAVSKQVNKDGGKGEYWKWDTVMAVARQKGVSFTTFNEADFYFTLNMMRSDYFDKEMPVDEVDFYLDLALDFLNDVDVPSNLATDKTALGSKAFRYWKKIVLWKPN